MARDENVQIPTVTRGDTRTLLEADFANQLIRAVNRMSTADVRVTVIGESQIVATDGNVIISVSLAGVPVGGALRGTLPNPSLNNVGTVVGSAGSNEALLSLLGILHSSGLITNAAT